MYADSGFNLDTNNCKIVTMMVKVNLCSLMTVVQEMVLFLVMKVLVFFIHVLDPGVRKYVLYVYTRVGI